MYDSGVKNLDNIDGELDENSRSTFASLNSEVSKHSCRLEEVIIYSTIVLDYTFLLSTVIWLAFMRTVQLFKGIASEADTLLNELHDSLLKQEQMLISYAQQQREVFTLLLMLQLSSKINISNS